MEEKKNELQKINPIKQFEQALTTAKNVKDILKIDVVKNRYVANYKGISGREDGLQVFESESFAFIDMANAKPEILECDPYSIVSGFLRASTYGLSFQGNHLSVYPRNVKQRDGKFKKMLVVEPQAHGKRRMLEKMPSIKEVVEGVLIYKGEEFVYDRKQKKVISHKSTWPEPEPSETTVVGAYCTIKFSDATEREVVVTANELKKARAASKMADGGDLWIKYYGEACKKTAYNRAFKVYWDKPQTDAVFTYTASPEDEAIDTQAEDVTDQIDATVIEQHATPAAEDQEAPKSDLPFQANVNESTGEIYPTEEVSQKEAKSTRSKRTPIA